MTAIGKLAPALADPVHDSQRVFRAILEAMSRPGRVVSVAEAPLGPGPLGAAATAVLLTLADRDSPIWFAKDVDTSDMRDFLRFHAGCPITPERSEATFAVATAAALPSLDGFSIGTDAFPDQAATLLIEVPALDGGHVRTWRGPGIETALPVAINGVDPAFWSAWAANHALFPCGIDVVFTSGNRLCALPRSVAVEA